MPPKRKATKAKDTENTEPAEDSNSKHISVEDDDEPKKKVPIKAAKRPKLEKESSSIPLAATDTLPHPTNATMPDDLTYEKLDGKVKITTWNIVSINSSMKKGLLTYLSAEDADVICLCETKTAGKVDGILEEKYPYQYWSVKDISTKNSYWAGVAVLSKVEPKSIKHGLGKDELDNEGRVIILEYQDFYLVHTYMPNASKELVRLTYKQTYNSEIEKLMKDLDTKKPVIWTGDLNVAHTAMDLARPDGNPKSAGFTKEERGDFTRILDGGFVDTWRAKHPKELKGYTYFGFRGNARGKYLGWRLDYFVVSKRFMENVHDSIIRSEAYGASDHVPIVLVLKDVAL